MSKKILIVDDNKEFGELMTDLLNLSGFSASHSLNLHQAKKLIAACGQPDFLLLDYYLKEGTTEEFAISLKSASPDAKIIMISGEVEDEGLQTIQNLVKEGIALDYIAKPFGETDFDRVILALEDRDAPEHHPAPPPPPGRQT